jgi:hypothetical protein
VAIAFTNLFTALGKLVGGLNEWNTGRGATLDTRASTLRTNLTAISSDLDITLESNRSAAEASGQGWVSYLSTTCWDTVRAAVLADRPQTDTSQTGVLTELCRQMRVSSENLATSLATIGSVTNVGSPTGTPTFVVSDVDGVTQARSDWTLPDVLLFTGVSESSVAVQGQSSTPASTYPDWPSGTGVNTTLSLIDASVTSLASDPGFESWNAGPPISPSIWSIVVGTAGSTVVRVTDTPITSVGSYSMQLLGDGTTSATPLRVRQAVTLSASTVYFIHAFMKRTANPANTGTLTVGLRDSSGNLLSGTTGISVLTSAISTSWTAVTAVVATPAAIPSGGAYLEIRYNPGNGDSVYLDQVSINALPALYTGGLRVAIVKGATAVAPGDGWTLTTTRANPSLSLIRGLNRLMSLDSYSVRIPTSGAGTQGDALVS